MKRYQVLGIEGEDVKIGKKTYKGRQAELIKLTAKEAEEAIAESKVEEVEVES